MKIKDTDIGTLTIGFDLDCLNLSIKNATKKVIEKLYRKAKCHISLKTYNPWVNKNTKNPESGALVPFKRYKPITEIRANEIAYLSRLKKRTENPIIGSKKST